QLPLGPRSGRAAVKSRLLALGYHPSDEEMANLFDAFKRLADEKKRIEDNDLQDLYKTVMQTV
ncbi:MAG: 2-isopropylmalate synthase, partial [Cyanobacteria bacterium]|nr:2-isopropylmalate synthase [Cyanobacteriota bacterium]